MASPQTTALTYNGYIQQIATLAVVNTTTVDGVLQGVDPPFNAIVPQMLNYAELRIQRDCDLMPSLTSNAYVLTPGSNVLAISVNDFVTVQTVGVTVGGALSPLVPVSKEWLQFIYGDPSFKAQPTFFAMIGGDPGGGDTLNNILVGPYPDINYPVAVMGTVRLPTLYQNATPALANTAATFISTYLPDLLVMASMIYISAFQRNFSSTGNDPQMPGSYELQYGNLLKNALTEEARKRFAAGAWSSMGVTPIATADRGN